MEKPASTPVPVTRLRSDPLRRTLRVGASVAGLGVPNRARRRFRRGDNLPRPVVASNRSGRSGTGCDPDLFALGSPRPRYYRDGGSLARSRPPYGAGLLRRLHLRRASLAHHLHMARDPGPHRLRLRREHRDAGHVHLPPHDAPQHRRLRRLRALPPAQPAGQGGRRPEEASSITRKVSENSPYEATSCNCFSRSLISSLSLAAYSNLSSSAASSISASRSAMRVRSSSGSRGASRPLFLPALYRPLASAAMRMSETPLVMVRGSMPCCSL